MRRAGLLMAVALVGVMACAGGAGADEAIIEAGSWLATAGEGDLLELSWRGGTLIQRAGVRAYLPNWQGTRFPTAAAQREVGADEVRWQMTEPGNQEATVSLRLGGDVARYELDTTIHAQGPTEFWAQIVPQAVLGGERCLVWADGRVRSLAADEPLETIERAEELRFESAERTVIIRTDGFQLQDRRDRGSGLFLVSVIGHTDDTPRRAERWIEIEVQPAAAEEMPARRRLVEQAPTEIVEVSLPNAGFESERPFAGWTPSPLAVADEEIAHSGRRSARLRIDGPVQERGHVYITRQVPIRPGHRYRAEAWIRGEEIRAAEQGGMQSVGATIIVEFADADGAWLAPGSYADSQFRSFDWRRVRTDAARAPEGAGRAVIFLALRGIGTAWFDDVRLEEVTHHPVLLEPMDGAAVHDNTPGLHWHFPRDAGAVLELSRDPEFGDRTTRIFDDIRSSAQIEEPLEPGEWHWRVLVPQYDATSATWSFRQTAALDEDTTEPVIAPSHGWLATARAPVVVEYSDNVGVERVRMTVDGQDLTDIAEVGAERALFRPQEPWTAGLHVVEVVAQDAAGNEAARTVFFTAGPPEHSIAWEEHGGVSIDGERRFLLGMYGVGEEHMPEIAAAGFDYVHSYRWDGSGSTEEALAYLDEAQRNGLRAFMGLERGRLMAGDERFVAERVAALMRHPALLAWYLYDEPDLEHQYVSPESLERSYRLISALDPFHPVVVTCARDSAVAEYRDALDVHWTQVYRGTDFVAARIDRHREMLREGTPLAAILHCYDRAQSGLLEGGGTPDPAAFEPRGALMRANAFMALAHNSSGLLWWWWGYGGSARFFTVANAPGAWTSLQETVGRIRELEPALTGEGEVVTRVLEPAEGVEVHLWEKRLADRVVTIAVNRDEVAVEAAWTPSWAPEEGPAGVRFEEREVSLDGGRLTDSFDPLGVHVYEW